MAIGKPKDRLTLVCCSDSFDDRWGEGDRGGGSVGRKGGRCGDWMGGDVDGEFDDDSKVQKLPGYECDAGDDNIESRTRLRKDTPTGIKLRKRGEDSGSGDVGESDEYEYDRDDVTYISGLLGLEDLADFDRIRLTAPGEGVSFVTKVLGKVRPLTKKQRSLSAKLIRLWARYHPVPEDPEELKHFRTVLFEKVFEGVVNVVSIRGLYSSAYRLMSVQGRKEIPDVEDNVLGLGRNARLYARLPGKVKKVFKTIERGMVAEAKYRKRRDLRTVPAVLESLEPFTEEHPVAAYDLEQRVETAGLFHSGFTRSSVIAIRKMESDQDRVLLTSLLMHWAGYYNSRPEQRDIFRELNKAGPGMFKNSLRELSKSVDTYVLAYRMLRARADAEDDCAFDFLENDIVELGRNVGVCQALPSEAKEFFIARAGEQIDAAVKRGGGRLNHIAGILSSLRTFTEDTHSDAYVLLEKVCARDDAGLLYDLYGPLGNLSRDAPDSVVRIISRVLDFIPEDAVMDDPEVRRIYRFLKKIDRLERLPDRLLDVMERRVNRMEGLYRQNRTPEVQSHHDIYNTLKAMEWVADEGRDDAVYELVDIIEDLDENFVYHYLLKSLDFPAGTPQVAIDATRLILQAYLPKAQVDDPYDLRDVRRRGDVQWVRSSIKKITECVKRLAEKGKGERLEEGLEEGLEDPLEERLVLPGPAVRIVADYAPQPCPDRLRPVLEAAFGHVGRVIDIRERSKDYWTFEDPAAVYDTMSSTGLDVKSVRRLPQDLMKFGLLHNRISYIAACCGSAWRELILYDAFVEAGVKNILMDLHDNSSVMRSKAMTNCNAKGLYTGVYKGDVADLSMSGISARRQGVMSIIGETAGNMMSDDLKAALGGFYDSAMRRYLTRGGMAQYRKTRRPPDILLVDGSVVKDEEKYERGWPFIWHAMNSMLGYDLDLFTHDERLCYTTHKNEDDGTIEVFFYISRTRGDLKRGDVIRAIDARTLKPENFSGEAASVGLASRYFHYPGEKVVAVCYLPYCDEDIPRR